MSASARIAHTDGLKVRRLGIDTYMEPVIFMRRDCHVCRSEGFEARSRVRMQVGSRTIIATLNVVLNHLLPPDEVGLSEAAWRMLEPDEGALAYFSHPDPLDSLSHVRAKIYGHSLDDRAIAEIVDDIVAGRYSDTHLAAFIAACGGERLELHEIVGLTRAMVAVGDRLHWHSKLIMDKHCIGGIPGNRTTLIVVPIVAAFGLTMPKTSSRAITSPAGTADTMATLAPVELSPRELQAVVGKENGCIVWGGAMRLSPADDILIRVERQLLLDSEGQLVASVLSKKAAAGSSHVLVDLPFGASAKVRSRKAAGHLADIFTAVGREIGIQVRCLISEVSEPVGFGIGPALEARDVLAVLNQSAAAPRDLRERSLVLAGAVLEQSGRVPEGGGVAVAREILESGRAWEKFQGICEAQGGMHEPPASRHQHVISAERDGVVEHMDIRRLSLTAKLAGAPDAVAAGVELHVKCGQRVVHGEPLLTVHADARGELDYALTYFRNQAGPVRIGG